MQVCAFQEHKGCFCCIVCVVEVIHVLALAHSIRRIH
jgi:hypothetical protein